MPRRLPRLQVRLRARSRRPLRLLLLLTALACKGAGGSAPVEHDLPQIVERDTLRVLTMFNSTSFFSYRGEPMGLEYELLRDFARERGLELDMEVVRDHEEFFDRLNRGDGDVVAARLIPTQERARVAAFTRAIYTTRPAIVQRSAPVSESRLPAAAESLLNWEEREPTPLRVRPITTPEELAGTQVHVQQRSPYQAVLVELSDTISGDIVVVEVEGDSATEALVRQVARGEIELAVSQENLAELKQSYFQNLEVRPALGPPHAIAWAVRRNSPALQQALNEWLAAKEGDGTIARLHRKYFVDRQGYRERVESEYLTSETGRLSPYDTLFRQHAPRLGWDWRLLAAQAYQESRFDPRARSWAGAMGLLQLMPGTARDLGVRSAYDPVQNVDGAVRFLEELKQRWAQTISDSTEQLNFVLASYNTGPGHVQDAQRLAEKHGGNPLVWKDVAFWLLQKSKREVYTDPVVRHGFSRGLEPVMYVQKIRERFRHYLEFVPVDNSGRSEG